jgi:hypothetical protein
VTSVVWRCACALYGVACVVLVALPAAADGKDEKVDWYFAPRVWYNSYAYRSYTPSSNSMSAASMPKGLMYGFSLGARAPAFPNTIFTLTAFKTAMPEEGEGRSIGYVGNNVYDTSYTTQFTRTDIEFLAQTSIAQTTANWIVGGRIEDQSLKAQLTQHLLSSNGATSETQFPLRYDQQIYSLKAGLGNYVPLSNDSTHRLFGNVMGVVGVQRAKETIGQTIIPDQYRLGVDSSIGYQYVMTSNLTFDIRYRFLANQVFNHPSKTTDITEFNHGPLSGLTVKW